MNYLIVLTYVFSFGIADCLWSQMNKQTSVFTTMLIRSMVTSLLFLVLTLLLFYFQKSESKALTVPIFLYAVVISIICYGGQLFYIRSLKHANIAVSVTLTTILSSFISLGISVVYFKEPLTAYTVGCLLIALTGVCVAANGFDIKEKPTYKTGLLFILIASICWGTGYTFIKDPIQALGIVHFSLVLEVTILVLNIGLFTRAGLNFSTIKAGYLSNRGLLLTLGSLIFLGTLFNSLSYVYFSIIALTVISKVGLIVPIVYATIVIKERLTIRQVVGIALTITGATTLAFSL